MKPRWFVIAAAALCGPLIIAGWMMARPHGAAASRVENADALSFEERFAAYAAAAIAPAPPAPTNIATTADVAAANAIRTDLPAAPEPAVSESTKSEPAKSEPAMATIETMATLETPTSSVDNQAPNSPPTSPPEQPPVQFAMVNPSEPLPVDANEPARAIEKLKACEIEDSCVDQYLWALYQRAPKEGTKRVEERREVTIRRRGKTVTVTRTFGKTVDEDFAWKDPQAAEKAGMPLMDYVIGGMEPSFKLKLYHTLRAAEDAGLSPGITSAFRDNYRQSIASGLKAASDRSYHGGSSHGGYGHGLAADIVSVKGETQAERWTSTEGFWKWIDTQGQEFGIGRPYLRRDPAHVAPLDGKEYVSRRGKAVQYAQARMKKRTHLAMRAKPPKARKLASLQRH